MFPVAKASLAGSSPRVRGKRLAAPTNFQSTGLIPACAGKTVGAGGEFLLVGAHPRVCGENRMLLPAQCQARGSSPRVRGKPSQERREVTRTRLIPACAGKTGV